MIGNRDSLKGTKSADISYHKTYSTFEDRGYNLTLLSKF